MIEMITVESKGNFDNTEKLLKRIKSRDYLKVLDKFGQQGVTALSGATPTRSGKTASSWDYEVLVSGGGVTLQWTNSNINNGVSIAIILQYGHGTRNGGYVVGRDYINPAMRPLFDKMADEAWKAVIK